jgi:hypothetical protein
VDVVIVPPSGLGGIYEDNRIWARQFVAADPEHRALIALARNDAQSVVDATRTAATRAGNDGRVIYAVGHGGSADGGEEAGQADLGPRRVLRVTQFVAFFDVSTTWSQMSLRDMERELAVADAIRGRTRRREARDRWCEDYVESECDIAMAQIRDRSRVQPYYDAIAQIFRAQPVRLVVLLTCNVGHATGFLDEVATDFRVPVRGFTRRVMSRREGQGANARVWMFLEGDAPGDGTNTDAARTELLPGMSGDDARTGRVIEE